MALSLGIFWNSFKECSGARRFAEWHSFVRIPRWHVACGRFRFWYTMIQQNGSRGWGWIRCSTRVIASVTDKWMWDSRCYDLQPVMDDGLSTLLVDLSNSRVDTKVRRNSVIRHAIHKNESCRATLFVPKNFLVYILLSPYNNMSSGVLSRKPLD